MPRGSISDPAQMDGELASPWEMVDPAFKITAQRQLLDLLKCNFGNKHLEGDFKHYDFYYPYTQ